jgi:hypothetical protein
MLPPHALLTVFAVVASSFNSVQAGSDCDILKLIMKKMGQTVTTTTKCCVIPSGLYSCSNSRISTLKLSNKNLIGSIPTEIGLLTGLRYLYLDNNQLNGTIPSTLGNLKNLQWLWLYNNKLTGFPSSLLSLSSLTPAERKLFPNPMSDIPYDAVVPVPLATLSNVTLVPFLNTPLTLRKRQALAVGANVTVDSLIQMCPLNNVQDPNVPAGCIAGIYNRYCLNPADSSLLTQCQQAYDQAFAASIFSKIGAVCPAWKNGPLSNSCLGEVAAFKYPLWMGKDSEGKDFYLQLTGTHAEELRKTIFASPKYAPCVAPTCKWTRNTS